LKLNPADVAVVAKLEEINKKLAETRLEKERNEQYDTALARAAQAFGVQAYNSAAIYYKEAASIKSDDPYPIKQIMIINGILLEMEEKKKQEEISKQRRQIIALKEQANNAILEKRWSVALQTYQEVLTLNPVPADREFVSQKVTSIQAEIGKPDALNASKTPIAVDPTVKTDKSQQKRDAIFEAQRQKQEKIRQDTIAAQLKRLEESKKQAFASGLANSTTNYNKNNGLVSSFWQDEAIPYQHAELVKRYPDINFEGTPDGQTVRPN